MRKGEYKIRVNIRFAPTSSVLNPVVKKGEHKVRALRRPF